MTIELETPPAAFPGGTLAARAPSTDAHAHRGRPWELAPEAWDRLAPRGAYALLRTPFLTLATLPLIPLALLVSVPIALINLWVHGSLRRILFAQHRVGWRGRIFVLYKFRTMLDQPGDDHARVTRFGRFLRNTHLDELPQLWNVLRGDMLLIGPRPEMVSTERWAARHCPRFCERLVLKPGITGYAQITQGYTDGGDEVGYSAKLELNRVYRERLSFFADCAILVRTVGWMLRGRGWRSLTRAQRSRAAA